MQFSLRRFCVTHCLARKASSLSPPHPTVPPPLVPASAKLSAGRPPARRPSSLHSPGFSGTPRGAPHSGAHCFRSPSLGEWVAVSLLPPPLLHSDAVVQPASAGRALWGQRTEVGSWRTEGAHQLPCASFVRCVISTAREQSHPVTSPRIRTLPGPTMRGGWSECPSQQMNGTELRRPPSASEPPWGGGVSLAPSDLASPMTRL